MVAVTMTPERATKNTVLFREEGTEKIRTLYVPKSTLNEMKWSDGDKIEVEVRVKKG